jgi:hypothetical protein
VLSSALRESAVTDRRSQPDDLLTRARQLVAEATTSGRGYDETTHLEVHRNDGRYRVACIFEEATDPVTFTPQIIAIVDGDEDAAVLAGIVLREADDRVREVLEMAKGGEIPTTVGSFEELHDHFDANMLGFGGSAEWLQGRPLIGEGAPDREEAECGVMNCANNAVDSMIRGGGLTKQIGIMDTGAA